MSGLRESRAPGVSAAGAPETPGSWLVERRGQPEPQWWAIPSGWTAEPELAVRFARRADAQAFIEFFALGDLAFPVPQPGEASFSPPAAGITAAERREALERLRLMAEGLSGDAVYDPSIYVSPAKTFYADMRLFHEALSGQGPGFAAKGPREPPDGLVEAVARLLLGDASTEEAGEAERNRALGLAEAIVELVRQGLQERGLARPEARSPQPAGHEDG